MKIEIEGDSEEAVAFALLRMVAQAEGKMDASGVIGGVTRDWLLDAYTECLAAVLGERLMGGPEDDEDDEDEDEEQEDDDAGEEEKTAKTR